MIANSRVALAARSSEFADFWRAHGREWAEREASPELRLRVVAIADGAGSQAHADIAAALRQAWDVGFSDPAEKYGWDEMGDDLPDVALAAFVEGVRSV